MVWYSIFKVDTVTLTVYSALRGTVTASMQRCGAVLRGQGFELGRPMVNGVKMGQLLQKCSKEQRRRNHIGCAEA